MPSNEPRAVLAGSVRTALAGARDLGPVPGDERIELTVRVRAARPAALPEAFAAAAASGAHLTRDELRSAGTADPAEVSAVEAFLRSAGLEIIESSPAERRIVAAGPSAAVGVAFGVELRRFRLGSSEVRGRVGPILVPAALADVIEGVFGLDDRPQASAHFRVYDGPLEDLPGRAWPATAAVAGSFSPPEIARLYDFLTDADGSGQAIALIELGGGYRSGDLAAWFGGLGISQPEVRAVLVDGGRNTPGAPTGADGEVMLDIEVAGSVAPGARVVVYFAPNTDRGFLDAITRAIHDSENQPSVISISWGGPESTWTDQAMKAMDQAFAEAALIGLTVTCASGDNGSDDRVGDGRAHADFPASSPNVLACGGTRIRASAGTLVDEVAWNDGPAGGSTGGGVSDVFDRPAWQAAAGVPASANPGQRVGRGLPDVAGDASPASGYAVRVDGENLVFGGTSAVAPLYAGLVACLNQRLGRPVGFLNPALYGPALSSVQDITSGSNGAYAAGPGWDACTGLGRIDGQRLLAALETAPGAPRPPR
jgi:kumamolisin